MIFMWDWYAWVFGFTQEYAAGMAWTISWLAFGWFAKVKIVETSAMLVTLFRDICARTKSKKTYDNIIEETLKRWEERQKIKDEYGK